MLGSCLHTESIVVQHIRSADIEGGRTLSELQDERSEEDICGKDCGEIGFDADRMRHRV